MKLKEFLPEPSTSLQLLVLAFVFHWFLIDQTNNTISKPSFKSPNIETFLSEVDAMRQVNNSAADISQQIKRLALNNSNLETELKKQIANGQFKQARTKLLEIAAQAAAVGDEKKVGYILLLLGGAAIDEQEINTAELLLHEALEIAISRGDTMAMGRSYQQLGRLNIKTRALARYASEAYDNLWIVRSQIFTGEYRDVEVDLQEIIDANLDIRRYGAAANALETKSEYHHRFHDDYRAQQSAIEAAKLYASSGQIHRSKRMIANLSTFGTTTEQIQNVRAEIDNLFIEHQSDAAKMAEAKDLQMLYRHHISSGNQAAAWDLRIKASKTLANTSDRSIFQRQAEVMAILYSSNFAMERAKQYLNQARTLFSDQGANEYAEEAFGMQSLIY
jgi:hypothetical protein